MAMRDGRPLEATITEGIAHPNIVNTLAHTVVLPEAPKQEPVMHDSAGSSWNSSGSGGPSSNGSIACGGSKQHRSVSSCGEGEGVAWLLLEFCDKGCLQARSRALDIALSPCTVAKTPVSPLRFH